MGRRISRNRLSPDGVGADGDIMVSAGEAVVVVAGREELARLARAGGRRCVVTPAVPVVCVTADVADRREGA